MNLNQKGMTKDEAGEYFLRYHSYVRYVAFRNAPNRSLMEDIVHDVYIYFVGKADAWERNDGRIRALLRSVTEHIAARYWREYKKGLPENLQLLAERLQSDPDEEIELFSVHKDLDDKILTLELCLRKLAPEYRSLVEGLYYNDLSYRELAEKLHKTPNALYKMMARIRGLLHDCIHRALGMEVDS